MDWNSYITQLSKYNDKYMLKDSSYYVMKLAEETGEVAEASIAMLGSTTKQEKLRAKGQTPQQSLEEELGDVLNVILTIGHSFGLDSDVIITAASNKIKARIAKKEKK